MTDSVFQAVEEKASDEFSGLWTYTKQVGERFCLESSGIGGQYRVWVSNERDKIKMKKVLVTETNEQTEGTRTVRKEHGAEEAFSELKKFL